MMCHSNCIWKFLCLIFLLNLSETQQRFMVEGRANLKPVGFSFTKASISEEGSDVVLRGQIGSRPPRCERRCSWCGHCEAIQVPTDPRARFGKKRSSNIDDARGDDYANYKPMSWKCKCGKFFFNP